MIEPIRNINAVKVVSLTATKGSAPIVVLCDDGNLYYAKTIDTSQPPFQELSNEIICNYFTSLWELQVPIPALITIQDDIVNDFLSEKGATLEPRYKGVVFASKLFFGSQVIPFQTEIEGYIRGFESKTDYNKFLSPVDFVKIAIFDKWICNSDRKPGNPNVLLSETDSKLAFYPIDHTAAFAHHTNLKAIRPIHMRLDDNNCLLNTNLSRSILKFTTRQIDRNLHSQITEHMNSCIEAAPYVFAQVPANWGFSKASKTNILAILADSGRNDTIAKSYISFIPKK